MKANISIGECIIRLLVGMFWAAIFGTLFTNWIALLGVLAIYPIVTALGGWDPIFGAMRKFTNEDSPYEEEVPSQSIPARQSEVRSNVAA